MRDVVARHVRVRVAALLLPDPWSQPTAQYDGDKDTKTPRDFNGTGGKNAVLSEDEEEEDERPAKRGRMSSPEVRQTFI